jgi:catechol 2,3-dioxygenase-like lactoylglutathione lyase family enzyme
MFSHVAVGSNDLAKAQRFYDVVLGALGYADGVPRSVGGFIYAGDSGFFIVAQPLDGRSATPANGGTIGFACQSSEEVDEWHAAGVASGGESVEDPPGVRDTEFGPLYLAYLRDPDGNKLCAFYPIPTRVR